MYLKGNSWFCEASLTCTEYAAEIDFDSAHHPAEEVRPGEDVPFVGHMGGWTAAGQDPDLQAHNIPVMLHIFKLAYLNQNTNCCIYLLRCENTIPDVELAHGADKGFDRVEALAPLILVLTQHQRPAAYRTQGKGQRLTTTH